MKARDEGAGWDGIGKVCMGYGDWKVGWQDRGVELIHKQS